MVIFLELFGELRYDSGIGLSGLSAMNLVMLSYSIYDQ